MVTTEALMVGGKNWAISLDFNFECTNKPLDSGVGFWITKNSV